MEAECQMKFAFLLKEMIMLQHLHPLIMMMQHLHLRRVATLCFHVSSNKNYLTGEPVTTADPFSQSKDF